MDGEMNGLIDEWTTVEKKTGVINGQKMDVVVFQIQREPDCQTFCDDKITPKISGQHCSMKKTTQQIIEQY